ncbi:hypothetical protein GY45DRAFT_1323351 [Cubamyces sp. BRFM 1775]|nr:hypothetical protein GY45DRAFT_1323351 [Cubamyces sp. BRFM 1775]
MASNVASTSTAASPEPLLAVTVMNQENILSGQPQSRTIATCVQDLRDVAATSLLLRQGLRDIGIHISRMNTGSPDTFGAKWTDISQRYERMLDEADRAASQIVAIFKVLYVVRESKTATPSQIVEELTAMRTKLEPEVYDVKSTAVLLKGDIEAFYRRVEKALHGCNDATRDSTNMAADAGAPVHSNDRAGSKPQTTPSSNPEVMESTHPIGCLCRKLFSILESLLSRLCIRSHRRKDKKDKARDLESGAPVTNQGPPKLGTDSAIPHPPHKPLSDASENGRETSSGNDTETESLILLESLKEVLAGIDKQTSKLDAFPQLAQQLQSTIDAYVTVLKGFGKGGNRKTLKDARPHGDELISISNSWAAVSASEVSKDPR